MANKKYNFKKKKRIVIKVGSSSITHEKTGKINFSKLEKLVRIICDIKNSGKDVCLVSSGAIAVGRQLLGMTRRPKTVSAKQAIAAVGQSSLMMTYQKLFLEYHQNCGQVLMTKATVTDSVARINARNTFIELLKLGIVPIVNENDTVNTYEIRFGDNDTLAALVSSLIDADLLILLSDIDGFFTENPKDNPDAKLIDEITEIDESIYKMASSETGSDIGTGGMMTKINAAKIATYSGADMVIANSKDFSILEDIIEGEFVGTVFKANKR